MAFVARWSASSAHWIRELPRFPDRLYPLLEIAAVRTARNLMTMIKPRIPVFEGDLQKDFRLLDARPYGNLRGAVRVTIGFTSATVMPEEESVSGPRPFAIGMGKHEPGATAHRVYLYNRAGASTPGRAKLIRWLKEHGGVEYDSLPEDASKADVALWRREVEQTMGFRPRAYVDVDPSRSATNFLWWLVDESADVSFSILIRHVIPAVRRVW